MYRNFRVDKIAQESATIKSFYLVKVNAESIEDYFPGQFITISISINGKELIRNYTISDAPEKGYFRLTIKREEQGIVSKYLHDNINKGDILNISKPTGKFHIDVAASNPVILISGGVGITPMLSMAEYIVTHQPNRSIHFLHSSMNKKVQPMMERLREMQGKYDNFKLSIFHTTPVEEVKEVDYDEEGFITENHLTKNLEASVEYYLCGPTMFMEAMYNHLIALEVNEKSIHYEFFGEGKKLGIAPISSNLVSTDIIINFSKSGVKINWSEESLSILELAEANGISPAFSCRMGTCSTCETTLTNGGIKYDPEPFMEATEGKIFICCAKPTTDIILDL
ncbi:MAG: ferredoxin-NADP reductase [Maribacter sp.]|jgi:ferredoxin-NADP reductase